MGSIEVGDENWTFALAEDDSLRLQLFHVKLVELLALYPWKAREPPPPESFMKAWQKGIDEYRSLYEKAMDFDPQGSYDNLLAVVESLHGRYENWRFGLPLLLIGQVPPKKESLRRVRKELIARFGPRCQLCHEQFEERKGRIVFEAHHVVPESCGGTSTLINMVPLCNECHSSITSPIERLNAEISKAIAESRRDTELGRNCELCRLEEITSAARNVESSIKGLHANIIGLQRYVDHSRREGKLQLKKTQYKIDRLQRLEVDYDRLLSKNQGLLEQAKMAELRLKNRPSHTHGLNGSVGYGLT